MVLKGPALSDWYPDDSNRTYGDGDVWVAPDAVVAAESVLSALGYAPTSDERGLPEWWLEHASNWQRDRDNVRIDLHRRLQGVELEPAAAWRTLWPLTEDFALAGGTARRLPAPARALYVTLHATHHGVAGDRGLTHLEAALRTEDDDTWRAAHALAVSLQALDGFGTGLRLTPDGEALARRIGVPESRSVRAALQASSPPPVALGLDELSRAPGTGARLAILIRKLVPPAGFVRHWWPPAARNRRMLLLGYLYRPVWLLRRAPAGYRAWRAAARAAKSSS